MTVEATTSSVPSLYTTGTSTTEAKKTMDQEVFLALLVAQLRNQDPTSPMDTTDMMAQSTQLATMEQLVELTDTGRESFALQMRVAASALIGQEVSFVDDDGATQTGVVSHVDFSTSVPYVTVGEWEIPLDAVSAVRAATTATTTTEA